MAEPSLIFSEMSLTANSSQNLTLHFVDDEVALEQLEVVKLELRSVPSPGDKCNNVRIEPHNTTTIYIQDDDCKFLFKPHCIIIEQQSVQKKRVCDI